MSTRDQFEQAYAAYHGHEVEWVKLHRLSNGSYQYPKIATAWHWWQRAKEAA